MLLARNLFILVFSLFSDVVWLIQYDFQCTIFLWEAVPWKIFSQLVDVAETKPSELMSWVPEDPKLILKL